jgi:hypothetical protein
VARVRPMRSCGTAVTRIMGVFFFLSLFQQGL